MNLPLRTLISLLILLVLSFPGALWAQAKAKVSKVNEEEVTFFEERDLSANFFKNETNIGGIFTTGNVQQISVEGKSVTIYRVKRFRNNWTVGGYYNRKFFDSDDPDDPPETIARYVYGTYRMDYFFTQNLTFFIGGGGYTDQVKGIPLGGTGFTGVSYYFIWTDKRVLNLAGGYQFVGEQRDPPDPTRILNTAKVELIFRQIINPYVTFFFTVDSLKDFVDLQEWLINGSVGFKVKIYKMLSLIVGFTVRFDNVPTTGFRKTDTITNLSLGVSFQSPSAKKGVDAKSGNGK